MFELVIFVVLLVFVALALWLVVAGDREQDLEDEVRFTTSYDDEPIRGRDAE